MYVCIRLFTMTTFAFVMRIHYAVAVYRSAAFGTARERERERHIAAFIHELQIALCSRIRTYCVKFAANELWQREISRLVVRGCTKEIIHNHRKENHRGLSAVTSRRNAKSQTKKTLGRSERKRCRGFCGFSPSVARSSGNKEQRTSADFIILWIVLHWQKMIFFAIT